MSPRSEDGVEQRAALAARRALGRAKAPPDLAARARRRVEREAARRRVLVVLALVVVILLAALVATLTGGEDADAGAGRIPPGAGSMLTAGVVAPHAPGVLDDALRRADGALR